MAANILDGVAGARAGEILPHPSLSQGHEEREQAEREWQDMVHQSSAQR